MTETELSAGDLVEICLRLPDSDQEITASARVVHVDSQEGSGCRAAVELAEINEAERVRLASYIRELSAAEEFFGGS